MAELNQENASGQSLVELSRRKRGRPVGSTSAAKWYAARGINPMMAGEILRALGGEMQYWKKVMESEDDRVVLQGLMFLMSMRDGKPAQQINVTSTSLNLRVDDIERARTIAAEIRADMARTTIQTSRETTHQQEAIEGEVLNSPLAADGEQTGGEETMLGQVEGVKKDG